MIDLKQFNKSVSRTNAITIVYYAEHGREKLLDFCDNLKTPCCISPLHDKDIIRIDEETGEIEYKKAHYHVLITFEKNQKYLHQWFRFLEPIRACIAIANFDKLSEDFTDEQFKRCLEIWEKDNVVHNTRTLLRYFNHKDNPEKAQYYEPCTCINGYNYYEQVFSQTDNLVIYQDIIRFCKNNKCYLYCDLLDYAMEHEKEWVTVLTNHNMTSSIIEYMKSMLYRGSMRYNYAVQEVDYSTSDRTSDSV